MFYKQNTYQKSTPSMANANQTVKNKTIQKKGLIEALPAQGEFTTSIQKKGEDEEEESLQMKTNDTGLPNHLKTGVETLSGFSMDDVKVHYNSHKPAQLQALAYAQGSDIHIAPGQERHLPHEAWHVAQQKQGKVKPTLQMKEGVNINDDAGLEKEADTMGAKANNFYLGKQKQESALVNKVSNNNLLPIQKSIGCHLNNNNTPEFQIDTIRPAWTGAAANIVLQQGQARCHIIAFEVIQNDLANILNNMLANWNTQNYQQYSNQLVNLCESLFVNPGGEKNNMIQHRTALINHITQNGLNLNLGVTTNLAGTLLSDLNSCADNLRAGDQGINASIGYNIDANFLGGIYYYHGPVHCINLPNAIPLQNLPQNAQVLGPGVNAPIPGGTQMAGPFACIKLSQAHERIVYEYQRQSTLTLSFVINGLAGANNQNANNGQHLSSTQMPVNFNNPAYPVLVQDPNGQLPPFVYN